MIQNPAIKCYHEFHLRLRKNLEMLILAFFFSLTNKSNLIVALYKIKGTILRRKKIRESKGRFTKCDVIF